MFQVPIFRNEYLHIIFEKKGELGAERKKSLVSVKLKKKKEKKSPRGSLPKTLGTLSFNVQS